MDSSSQTAPARRAARTAARTLARWAILSCLARCAFAQEAQPEPLDPSSFIPQTAPYPVFYSPAARDYNLKWGKITGRLYGDVQTEFNDNINLAQTDPRTDLILSPNFGIGFLWPVSEKNVLQFDIGVGYRSYLNNSALNSLQISPDSRLNYQIRVLKAQITVHDQFSVQVDPLSRPELSGDSTLLNYKRFNNNLGFDVTWEPIREITLLGGYSYGIDRSMNADFRELDRDDHNLHLAAFRPVGARLLAGLAGSYTLTDYQLPIQNGGHTYSIGPHFVSRLSDFITADAGLSYTIAEYDQTGAIQDASDFHGLTYGLGLSHRVNSRASQYLRISKSINPGFESNFTDILTLQYGLSLRVSSAITLNGTFAYENLTTSGSVGEDSSRYLWYLGTSLRVTRRWTASVSYSFAWKDSQLPERDYTQNRVTLDLTRQF